jgi:pimeloyl-ACP methyl ester carboxylesterase
MLLGTFRSGWPVALMASFALAVFAAAAHADTVQTRAVAYDQIRLTVLDQGRGAPIVMIPSLGRGASDFDDLAERLTAAGYRVVRLQPRGVGGSVGPMTGLSMHNLADDVAHVITGLHLGHAIVLGHDDGNRIARATAAYHPDLVSAVILVGAGGKVKPDPAAWTALNACFDATLSADRHLAAVAEAFFAPGNDPSPWRDGWYPEVAKMERGASIATPVADWWTAGSAPILVVQGDQDRIAPPQNAALLKADVGARAEVVYVDHAGHALLPEQPKALADAIIAYLRKARATAG